MSTSWSDELRALDEIAPSRDLWADALARARSARHRRPSLLRIGLLAAVLAAAAAGAYVLATSPGQTTHDGDIVQVPTPVADAAAADALLPFNVVLPSDTTPTSLTVVQQAQALYSHFDSSTDGSYVLDEQPSNLTVADLQQLEQDWHPSATHTVAVVSGVHVLIQTFKDGSVEASWLRGDGTDHILSWVEGPDPAGQASSQTFSEQRAIAIASDIIGQGG